ncbi:hypothetical protein FJTKL_03707 [Diaporthe vaccinii]|uniref:Cytochrome P450 n=1 Tax=Diaporthe vaccinii TaxID=105482 RepID=A0ABR4DV97_9PEZI
MIPHDMLSVRSFKTVLVLLAGFVAWRLSPEEISFNAIDIVDQIYGQNTDFPKAQWYKRMTRGGVFNETDISIHRHKRKMLNHVFAQSSVNDMEPTIRHEMRKLLDRIEERRQNGSIDMRHWLRMLAFDVSTMVFFGQAAGGLDSHQIPQYVKDLDNAFLIWDLRGRFPTMSWLFAKLPLKSVQFFFQSDDRIYEYGAKRFQQYIDKYGRASQRKDLLTKLIRKEPGQDDGLTDEHISGEIANLTFAATDTAALTLLYLFWELAQMPELQQQLRDKLRTVPMLNGIPEHKHLWNLPLLNAVINETLRKHSPVVMGLLREVPPGGREMEGYYIPAKTVVSMPSYTAHRDPKAFPEPEAFKPSRWLETNGGTEEMRKLFMPFTKGTRQCPGQSMAIFEMRIIIATFIKNYILGISRKTKPEDMDFVDYFLMIPKGEHIWFDLASAEKA